jgi:hypothetical protein
MKFTTLVAAATLALSSQVALAADYTQEADDTPSAGAMAFDLLIVRPVSLVAMVGGVALFVVDLPLSILQGEPPSAPADRFIVGPAKFTFQRPLGQMN